MLIERFKASVLRISMLMLRERIASIVLCACVALACLGTPLTANAQVSFGTVSSVIDSLKDLAKNLEQSARSLLQQGNNILAQQQMIAAGSLRSLANQLSETYKGRLNDTAEKIAIGQSNLSYDANELVLQAQRLEKGIAGDAKETIYQFQGAVNQIMKRLPFSGSNPVFYGMIVHDVSSPFAKMGYDLELVGLNMTSKDRELKQPKVMVGADLISQENISVQEDRVHVVLPKPVKDRIGFREDACPPPSHFLSPLPYSSKPQKTFCLFQLAEMSSLRSMHLHSRNPTL